MFGNAAVFVYLALTIGNEACNYFDDDGADGAKTFVGESLSDVSCAQERYPNLFVHVCWSALVQW